MSGSNNDSKSKWRCNYCNCPEWEFRSVEEAICHEKNCSRMKCSGIALDRISRSQCSDFFYKHRAIQALVSREKEECFFKLRQHDLLCRKGARIMPSTYSPRLFFSNDPNRTSREDDPTGRLLRIARHLPFTTTLYIEGIHTIREGNIERKCVTVKVRGGRAMLKEGRGLRLMVLHQKENKLKMYREGDSCILNMGDRIKITRSIHDKLVAFGMNYAVVGFYSPQMDISPSRDLNLIPKAATYYNLIPSHCILLVEIEIVATKKLMYCLK